ncbi:hypothetical protein BSKO_13150 [Bryopsis sp. KO-2023]|nr:hypothetical protein BSKO_13150 [Bryopsis sp. KO-2023]
MSGLTRPAVVMDCGTGFTKLGFGGNVEPNFCIPTTLCSGSVPSVSSPRIDNAKPLDDFDVRIGDQTSTCASTQNVEYPVRHGMVENWGAMEKYWLQCVYKYLRVDPEDHFFVLTEPPLNPPEHREYTAEIMFETFNVSGLFIGVQAVLALYASMIADERKSQAAGPMTGLVIDSGEGVTHVIPVVESHVIGSSIKSIPFAGRDVTSFIQQLVRDRGEAVPPDMSMEVARMIKENHSYVCSDIVKEFARFDADPQKHIKKLNGVNSKTGKPFSCDVGYERFLGPEIFFNPEIYTSEYSTPLPAVVDDVVQSCPIDTKRQLYGNIVLSGGSTMFRDFGRRLERDIATTSNNRLAKDVQPIEVNVVSHSLQRYAVWLGGSLLSTGPEFHTACKTREEYQEYGPSICRPNYVFRDV